MLWSEDATHVMLLGTRRCVSVWEAVERRGWEAGEPCARQKWGKKDLASQAKASGGELQGRETGWMRRGELLKDTEVGSPTKDGCPWPRWMVRARAKQ